MKKLHFLLALLLAVLVLVSCGETTPETTQAPTVFTGPDEPAIPGNLDLSGDFNILVTGSTYSDFQGQADSATAVDLASYQRNEAMREKHGVNITREEHIGYDHNGTGYRKLYTEYMAGMDSYDAASVNSYDVVDLAQAGVLWDLSSLPYMDLSKPYWDQQANKDLAIFGKMFFTTGDISTIDNTYTHVMYFNKDMMADYGFEAPYQLVKDGEWTLEALGKMVRSVGQDVNNDGVMNGYDLYGLHTWNDPMLAVLASAGERITTVQPDGTIKLTVYSERTVNLYDVFCDLMWDLQHVYNSQWDLVKGGAPDAVQTSGGGMFAESRALFVHDVLGAADKFREYEIQTGILPYPKLDVDQESYGSPVSAYHTQFFCIPLMAEPVRSGAVSEILAHYGKEILSPAYYDKTLYGKDMRDEESAEMLDIILSTHVFDIGGYYRFGDMSTWIGRIYRTGQTLTNIYETYREAAEAEIAEINKTFDALSDDVVYSGNGEIVTEEEVVVDLPPYTDATVVYLSLSGKGNGSTPENAIGTMQGALDALDLSKDCTVVVCGKYMFAEDFRYTELFDGSVTVTSVYDGVDYRDKGAEIIAPAMNFVCSGEYIFRDVDFRFMDKYFRILASHYPITIDTGVNFAMENAGMNGLRFGESVCILGGHYQGAPVLVGGEKPVSPEGGGVIDITIKSGSHYCIGVFSHSLENSTYPGKNVINIGGDAEIPTLWILPENAAFEVGEVEVNVTENAHVGNIYGSSAFGHVDTVTINWLGGTIDNFEKSRDKVNPDYEAANGTHLVYSEAVAGHPNLATLTERFDSVTQK